jgi:DNA repair exonuclease SbcCD ATPase subunit
MKAQPYINRRKWLEKRSNAILCAYRGGSDWQTIVSDLKNSEKMPFDLSKDEFFKYCDFLLDDVADAHKTENEQLQQQLAIVEQQKTAAEQQLKKINAERQREQQSAQQLQQQLQQDCEQKQHEIDRLTAENQTQKEQIDNTSQRIAQHNESIKKHNETVYAAANEHYKKEYNNKLLAIIATNFFLKIIIAILCLILCFCWIWIVWH